MGGLILVALLLLAAKAAEGSNAPKSAAPPPGFKPVPPGTGPGSDPGSDKVTKPPIGPDPVSKLDPGIFKAPTLGSAINTAAKMAPLAPTTPIFPSADSDWPGVKSLPATYRDPALAAVAHVRYGWIMATSGPIASMDPCSGAPCTSAAVYDALAPIQAHRTQIDAMYGGIGGAKVDLAIAELGAAYARLQAVGR